MSYFGNINGETKLIGLYAYPISHSKSPLIHNAGFKKLNLNYAFLVFEVGDNELESAIKGARTLNVQGLSVSMPNKIKVIDYLDEVSSEAKLIGAVNTILNDNGKLIGYNTDGYGYIRSLIEEGINFEGKKFTILGAGGAAKAIAIQAALDGAGEIAIFNRNDELYETAIRTADIINSQTECKAKAFQLEDQKQLKKEIETSFILVNATSIGMKDLEGQSLIPDSSWLRSDLIVTDVIYVPEKTKLLQQAEEVGCKTINGLGMLLFQAAKQFNIWTGEQMPIEYVKEQVLKKTTSLTLK